MPAITIADLTNAKLDVDHIAAVANSTEPTATDRLGHVKSTVAGAVDSIKAFNNRGAWAAVTIYAGKDLVLESGTWYVCVVPHTSSAAFATDVASKWRIHQGVTLGELAADTGADLVGTGDGRTVQEWVTDHDFDAVQSRLFSALSLARNDVFVLCQGDSTGNETTEWYYRMAVAVAALYPAYTVTYIPWNDGTTLYDAAVALQTGTSGKVLRFYNASVPGASPDYFNGPRRAGMYDGWQFDLVITNLGLNVGESFRAHASKMTQYLAQLTHDQPTAEVLITLQPPDYTDGTMLDRSANRVAAQRWIAGQFGCEVIDVFRKFKALVDADGGVDTTWYLDHIHPTTAGSIKWSGVALKAVATSRSASSASIRAPLGRSAPVAMPNGNFDSWVDGSSTVPTWWHADGCTVIKDTSTKETGEASVRATGSSGSTGTLYVIANELMARFGLGNDVVIAARVWSEGASYNPGRVFCAHSATTAYTEVVSPAVSVSEGNGAWRWVYLIVPASFYSGHSDFVIGVYSGLTGEYCRVDRILIGNSIHLADSDGACSWGRRSTAVDTAHTVAAGATATRVFSSGVIAAARCRVAAYSPDLPAGIVMRAVATALDVVTIYLTNVTASSIDVPAMAIEIEVS